MTSGIAGARLKLARAHEHASALAAAVNQFRVEHPYRFAAQVKLGEPGSPHVYLRILVSEAHDVPDSWSLMLGDVLTNLRAALDHSVFTHIRTHRPDLPENKIQYPIDDKREQFDNKIRHFERPVYRAVNDSQPYRVDEPCMHPLATLRDLVNYDKHRTMVVTNCATLKVKLEVDESLFDVVAAAGEPGTQLEVGAVVGGVHLRVKRPVTAPENTTFRVAVEYDEVIELPNAGGRTHGLLAAATHMCETVDEVLDALENAGV